MGNPVIKAHREDLMRVGFLFLDSDPDTAEEAIRKLRDSAEALEDRVIEIRSLAKEMEAKLNRYTVEQFNDGYVVIYTDALGRRWQDHMGTLTQEQAQMLADRRNAEVS